MEYRSRSKRHRSPLPSTASHMKDEEVEEDPTYRQFLATVRTVLDLPTLEDTVEVLSKIFSFRDRGKKRPSPLPMSLPPMEELNDRWKTLEKKAAGNPQAQDSDKLQSTPFNTDSFLSYNRLYMKFYKTTTSEFALSAPKCQDSFKFTANKSFFFFFYIYFYLAQNSRKIQLHIYTVTKQNHRNIFKDDTQYTNR